MEVLVKCRKDYICECCEQPIKKGEYSLVIKKRLPRYDSTNEHFKQIGVEYAKVRLHAMAEVCNKVNGFEVEGDF